LLVNGTLRSERKGSTIGLKSRRRTAKFWPTLLGVRPRSLPFPRQTMAAAAHRETLSPPPRWRRTASRPATSSRFSGVGGLPDSGLSRARLGDRRPVTAVRFPGIIRQRQPESAWHALCHLPACSRLSAISTAAIVGRCQPA
jgi:hypothetical protein